MHSLPAGECLSKMLKLVILGYYFYYYIGSGAKKTTLLGSL